MSVKGVCVLSLLACNKDTQSMKAQIMFIKDIIWPDRKHDFFNDVIQFHF